MMRVSFWTCVFLIVLRICIGWHFYFEGSTKVKSAYQGKAAGEKVFSSENYFRESEGPFGKLVKSHMVDPDQLVVDQLTLKSTAGDPDSSERFPEALAREWDDYFNRFVGQFRLEESTKAKAQALFDQAKVKYVMMVQGYSEVVDPATKKTQRTPVTIKAKRKAPGVNNQSADFEQDMTYAERAAELQRKMADVRAAFQTMFEMGKDVDAAGLRTLKGEVNAIRTELRKDIDDQTKAMKDGLAKLLDVRVSAFATQANNQDAAATLEAMVTPMADGKNPLAAMWNEYAAYVKDFSPGITDEQKTNVDEELRVAKMRFDRWLSDKDMFTNADLPNKDVAEWHKLYAAAKAKKGNKDADEERTTLISRMQAELKAQADAMRAQVGTPLLGEDRAKGHASTTNERWLWVIPKNWTVIDYLDWSTRWFLVVVGATLMIGLFTRLSCLAAVGFLLLTILTQPSVPWLPAPPINEGSYLFVNKNVIEMVALMALMTTRSGRWFGLDALVHCIFKRREKPTKLVRR